MQHNVDGTDGHHRPHVSLAVGGHLPFGSRNPMHPSPARFPSYTFEVSPPAYDGDLSNPFDTQHANATTTPLDNARLPLGNARPPLNYARPPLDSNARRPLDNARPPLDNARPPLDNARPPLDNALPPMVNERHHRPSSRSTSFSAFGTPSMAFPEPQIYRSVSHKQSSRESTLQLPNTSRPSHHHTQSDVGPSPPRSIGIHQDPSVASFRSTTSSYYQNNDDYNYASPTNEVCILIYVRIPYTAINFTSVLYGRCR